MTEPNYPIPFEAPEPERLAPLFPGYSIEYLIATGGMGAVYKAVQNSLDRPVAIKILPREFGQDKEFRANFETEAKTMARLNHPNLIGVYDFGEVDGMLFIIMEFVPGKTLFHSAHGTAIAAEVAARIVVGVCQALGHAHEHGILHRDIKPGNILLDQQARPKIGDFGLARPIGEKVKDGETIFGTPHYTAPEVIKSPNSVDARADIFSVGVVFHELLTGRLPAADSRPPSLISGCDPRFDAIIRRATNVTPELRYASAAEMAKDISAVTSNAPSQAAIRRTGAAAGPAAVAASGPAQAAALRTAAPVAGLQQLRRPAGRSAPVATPVPVPTSGSGNSVGVLAFLAGAAAIGAVAFFLLRGQGSVESPPPELPKVVEIPGPGSKPAPKPKPSPSSDPAPKPSAGNEVAKPSPKPAVTPEVAKPDPAEVVKEPTVVPPLFDVPTFLDKARSATRLRAARSLAENNKEIEKNYSAFERRVKREVRDLDKVARGFIENKVEENLSKWRMEGNRVPKTLELPGDKDGVGWGGPGKDKNDGFLKSLKEIHADFLAKQQKIDDQLKVEMLGLATTFYLPGLKKKIDLLGDPNQAPAVALIQAEIDLVQNNVVYFITLMRGVTADVPAGDSVKIDP